MNNIEIKRAIENILGEKINFLTSSEYGITTQKIKTVSGKLYFLKYGSKSDTYICEANGLKEIQKSGTVPTPKVIAVNENYLLTEYIEKGKTSPLFFESFGECLAQMHRFEATSFGFYENNYIGLNPQVNIANEAEKTDWISFYFNKRLLFQYKLAEKNGYVTERLKTGFSKLEKIVHKIFDGTDNTPVLLHGDLWNGNYMCGQKGEAVLVDPAVYYGNREADLAMTKLFGGFPAAFYSSYNNTFPLTEGCQHRENIYKLYHVLNHLNLFGSSYLHECENLIYAYL